MSQFVAESQSVNRLPLESPLAKNLYLLGNRIWEMNPGTEFMPKNAENFWISELFNGRVKINLEFKGLTESFGLLAYELVTLQPQFSQIIKSISLSTNGTLGLEIIFASGVQDEFVLTLFKYLVRNLLCGRIDGWRTQQTMDANACLFPHLEEMAET